MVDEAVDLLSGKFEGEELVQDAETRGYDPTTADPAHLKEDDSMMREGTITCTLIHIQLHFAGTE